QMQVNNASSPDMITGLVIETINGISHPLAGASIQWLGTSSGTVSNPHGAFQLKKDPNTEMLVISYAGFRPDTLSVSGMQNIEVSLYKTESLGSIVIRARVRPTYIDQYNPFRTAIITKKELLKAACCNLSESFETNPSVDVSYSDAATGSKQIQLLGLAGVYTQLTVENLPGPRGIATPLGLNSIAGPWVESIQLIKGTGSVVNGFESIAGQINVELRKPMTSEKLYLNGYVNTMGKTDLNLNWAHKINRKWSTGLLLHDNFLYSKQDFNNDGFRDLPTGNQFSAVHRWQYLGDNGLMSQFGFKLMHDDKVGGQLSFDPSSDKFSTTIYGLGINTKRYEVFAKTGYVFPEKMHKSIGLQVSAFDHIQDSYFGIKRYDARQRNFYGNLIYQSRIHSDVHRFKTGISFNYDDYQESLQLNSYDRTEMVPGAFAEYTFSPNTKWDIVTGIRADHNNLYGWFATPRVNVRYAPGNTTTLRFSAGRGQRTANIIAENMGVLVSSRALEIQNSGIGKAYGLKPEVAWNKGLSLDQKFKLFGKEATLGIDFYRNDFVNQVIVDLEDARKVRFYNLEGKSYSNSFQAELSFTPAQKFDVRLAYRYFDVKATYSNKLLEKPFTARHRAFINMAYDLKGWKLDYTANLTGSKRIPSTIANPSQYQLPGRSPAYVTMNAQVSKSLGKKKLFDLYLGGENLTNYFQENAILSADQPFGPHFDGSMVWGPVSGRLVYAGFRYTIK
ncbi:MAG: TonB-dependent receptor, partial [Flavisolibacter sp.]